MHSSTIRFYEDNASEYSLNTIREDMRHAYSKFIPMISKNGSIVDAGCGSGRDSIFFLNQGFEVSSFDASSKMVEVASRNSGMEIWVGEFKDFHSEKLFDGVWACASLLHLSRDLIPGTIQHLSRYLKNKGVFYLSFKFGTGERESNGRFFCDMDHTLCMDLIQEIDGLELREYWTSVQSSADHETKWSNLLLQKIENCIS
ncbi:MAG: methyltransferase domain-containing protein [Planctomycetia bacterium]|nr:methyltransferase domain-containing protein [Planctomycetia bacterium]MBL6914186.1 methyltransferase domain-containing protein [Planctomycetota bacterium]